MCAPKALCIIFFSGVLSKRAPILSSSYTLSGANRLGGNSLADLLVFGKYVGINASAYAKTANLEKIPEAEIKDEIKRVSEFINPNGTNPGRENILCSF